MPTNNYDLISRGLVRVGYRASVSVLKTRFLQDVIFGGVDILGDPHSNLIGIDWRRIVPSIAEEAVFGLDPKRVNFKTGFNEKYLASAYFNDMDTIDYTDAETRVFGEDLSQNVGNLQRVLTRAALKRDAIIDSHRNALELLCAEALLTGKVTVRNGGIQTFPMTSSLYNLAGKDLLKDPVKTIAGHINTMHKINATALPKTLLMNFNDATNFIVACEKYLNKDGYNTAKAIFGEFDKYGVVYDGDVTIPGAGVIQVLHYVGALNNKDLIPQGTAVLLPFGGKIGSKGYARVLSADNSMGVGLGVVEKERTNIYPSGEGDSKVIKIQQQTAPLPIITAIDSYGVITGIPATV